MLLLGVKLFVFSRDIGNCRLALKNGGAREVGGDVIRIHLWDGRYWLLRLYDCGLCNLWLLDLLLLGLLRLNDCLLRACCGLCLLLHLRLKLLEQLLLLKDLLLQQLLTGQ